jgi:hypothetical protein
MTNCQRAVTFYPIATTPFIQVHIQREGDRERQKDRDRETDRERAFAAVGIDPAHTQTQANVPSQCLSLALA